MYDHETRHKVACSSLAPNPTSSMSGGGGVHVLIFISPTCNSYFYLETDHCNWYFGNYLQPKKRWNHDTRKHAVTMYMFSNYYPCRFKIYECNQFSKNQVVSVAYNSIRENILLWASTQHFNISSTFCQLRIC
jgi:hypothetical protein